MTLKDLKPGQSGVVESIGQKGPLIKGSKVALNKGIANKIIVC